MPPLAQKQTVIVHLAVSLRAKMIRETIFELPTDQIQLNRWTYDCPETRNNPLILTIASDDGKVARFVSRWRNSFGSVWGMIESNGCRAALALASFTFLSRFLYSALTLSDTELKYFWSFNAWGEIAANVAAGNGLAQSALLGSLDLHEARSTAARSPLPVLLDASLIKMFGYTATPICVMQALLEAATAAVIVVAGKLIAHRYIYGVLGGLLYVGFVPAIHYARTMGSEPLAALLGSLLALNLAFCARYAKPFQFLSLGALLGALTLTRPVYVIYLAPLLVAFSANRFVILILLSFTTTVFPWGLRNYMVFGTPIITTSLGGYNLYRHNEPLSRETYLEEAQQRHDATVFKIKTFLNRQDIAYEDLNDAQLDELLKQEALKIIRTHPVRYLRLSLERARWLFSSNGRQTYPTVLVIMLLIFACTAYGLYWHSMQQGNFEAALFSILIVMWVLVHSLLVAQLRYLIPIMPLVSLFAAIGFAELAARNVNIQRNSRPTSTKFDSRVQFRDSVSHSSSMRERR